MAMPSRLLHSCLRFKNLTEAQFLAVYKQGAEFTSMGGCTESTHNNQTDSGCCCVQPGKVRLRPSICTLAACFLVVANQRSTAVRTSGTT